MPEPRAEPQGRMGRWRRSWGAHVSPWVTALVSAAAFFAAVYAISGWVDTGASWYVQRAVAGDLNAIKRDVEQQGKRQDNLARLTLQKQEIEYSKEIVFYERAERAGRLSPGEESYLNIIRIERRKVRDELQRLPPVRP